MDLDWLWVVDWKMVVGLERWSSSRKLWLICKNCERFRENCGRFLEIVVDFEKIVVDFGKAVATLGKLCSNWKNRG